MANEEHLDKLVKAVVGKEFDKPNEEGINAWNEWRKQNKDISLDLSRAGLGGGNFGFVDLSGADLSGAMLNSTSLFATDLHDANLSEAHLDYARLYDTILFKANLSGANLSGIDSLRGMFNGANLYRANLTGANIYDSQMMNTNLSGADLSGATLLHVHLEVADLSGANLSRANLIGSYLIHSNLSGANLSEARLDESVLVDSDLTNANLSGCRIFGISAWKLKLNGAIQSDLIITERDEPIITVDNIQVAQFMHLILNHEEIRTIIDTIGKKAVLILGRFTPERKAVLNAIREELRKRSYLPILFDFQKPVSRDLTETIVVLAHLSRFIIADLTDPKSIPHEVMSFVPNLPSVAVQPIIYKGERAYAMFEHLQRYPWVLPIYEYETQDTLIAELADKIIQPAENKVNDLRPIS